MRDHLEDGIVNCQSRALAGMFGVIHNQILETLIGTNARQKKVHRHVPPQGVLALVHGRGHGPRSISFSAWLESKPKLIVWTVTCSSLASLKAWHSLALAIFWYGTSFAVPCETEIGIWLRRLQFTKTCSLFSLELSKNFFPIHSSAALTGDISPRHDRYRMYLGVCRPRGKRRKIFVVGRKKENMIARGNVFPRAMRYAWKTKI